MLDIPNESVAKRSERKVLGRKRKTALFADGMIIYLENPRRLNGKLLAEKGFN